MTSPRTRQREAQGADLLAVAAWYMDRQDEARKHMNRAIVMAPFDPRLQRNHALIEGVSDALDPEPRDA